MRVRILVLVAVIAPLAVTTCHTEECVTGASVQLTRVLSGAGLPSA